MQASRGLGQVVILAAIFVLFGAVFAGFVQPILSGLLVAFVLYPLNARSFGPSPLRLRAGALLSTLLFAVFVLLPLCYVGYILSKDGVELINGLRTGSLSTESLNRLLDRFLDLSPVPREEVVTRGKEALEIVATTAVTAAGNFARGLPGFVLSVILFLLTLFYGLSDGPALGRFVKSHLPFRPELVARLSLRTEQIVRGTVWGTVLSAFAQALMIGGVFLALDIPRAFVVGLATFFFSFIPVLGTAPTGLGGIIYLIAQDSPGKAVILGVVFVMATMVDNVIKPIVLKGAADLHPLLALLSAIGGLAVFGFIGLFMGPLVTALTIEFLEVFREERAGAEALT